MDYGTNRANLKDWQPTVRNRLLEVLMSVWFMGGLIWKMSLRRRMTFVSLRCMIKSVMVGAAMLITGVELSFGECKG